MTASRTEFPLSSFAARVTFRPARSWSEATVLQSAGERKVENHGTDPELLSTTASTWPHCCRPEAKAAPEAAQFQWRTSCTWQNGTHSHSNVEGFFGLGAEQHHKRQFSFDADHPELFASEDNGVTPVEYALVALASCLTAGVAAVAQNLGDPAAVRVGNPRR